MRAAVLCYALLALTACPKEQGASDRRSTSLATAKERVTFLKDFAACPTEPQDAAWHIYETDDGTVVHAIVKIAPADAHLWSMGCGDFNGEARPKWVSEVLPPAWKLKTIPDTWSCGRERRVIHVKEGLVIRALLVPHAD